MIPFATPRKNEVINLSQIVKIRVHEAGTCQECNQIAEFEHLRSGSDEEYKPIVHIVGQPTASTVYWSDGTSEIFADKAHEFLHIEVKFMLITFRKWQKVLEEGENLIIQPSADAGRIM
jgi:hypothetical protein